MDVKRMSVSLRFLVSLSCAWECYFGCMCETAIFPPCKQYFLLVKKEALQKERR